jgi:hypothetical protein
MRTQLALALLVVPTVALATPRTGRTDAKGGSGPTSKSPSACGVKVLPLVEGNSWTYAAVGAPNPPDEQLKRITPIQPKSVVITVKSIDSKHGTDTVITLEEKVTVDLTKDEKKPVLDERTLTTTITCNAKNKFEIAPDSFFFAGEPGGFLGLAIDKLDHSKDTSWKLTNGSIGEAEWREDLVAHWTRKPTPGSEAKLGSGQLELERQWTPQQPEIIITKLGSYRAEKLGVTTTGRVTLDNASPDAKPMELPAGWINQLWLADGIGVVQVLNHFNHMYQLTDATLK